MSFAELGLSPETLKAVEEAGYLQPTPIQEQAIPYVLMGRDVLGIAQTGTGKTASFTLPMIDILAAGRAKARMPRSLILCPTRELAAQVAENFEKYGKHQKLTMALLIGGESMGDQIAVLDRGVDVLIATPGRMLDMFERGRVLLNDVKILVIDEADRMLDMGFIPDVERIVGLLSKMRQTLFFSATMPPEVRRLADAFLMNPKSVSVAAQSSAAETVTQGLVVVEEIDKRESLRHLLRMETVKNALIFCNRKRDVDVLYRSLVKHGFSAARLHGDMSQPARTETLAQFKAGEATLMVCSDVAARGIDIKELSHVFNFDVPIHAEDYVHRIGRTGRAGREGRAFTIATPEDGRFVKAIEKIMGREIPRVLLEGMEELPLEEGDRRRKRAGRPDPRRDKHEKKGGRREERAVRLEAAEQPETPERHETERRDERPIERARERHERPHEERRGNGKARRERRREFDEFGIGEMKHADGVVGFGDHVPDFMTKTYKLPKKVEAIAEEEE